MSDRTLLLIGGMALIASLVAIAMFLVGDQVLAAKVAAFTVLAMLIITVVVIIRAHNE